jgi:hypothetical protein
LIFITFHFEASRRAIQLGLKNVNGFCNGDWIVDIQDISAMVREQANQPETELLVPQARVYIPQDIDNARRIRVDVD